MKRVPYFRVYCMCVVCAIFTLESCSREQSSDAAKDKERGKNGRGDNQGYN